MSPRRSNTMVLPSGETSSDIHVPCVTSYSTTFEFARLSLTFHLAGTAVLVAGGVLPDGGVGLGEGGFWADSGTARAKAAKTVSLFISERIEGVDGQY